MLTMARPSSLLNIFRRVRQIAVKVDRPSSIKRYFSATCTRLADEGEVPIKTSHDVTEAMKHQPLVDDDKPHFPGTWKSKYTDQLKFTKPELNEPMSTYRVLNWDGDLVNADHEPQLSKETTIDMYKGMVTLHIMDDVLFNAQRQGRIVFYMTANGEEASHIGSAAALDPEDEVFAQYREQGVLMWRGFSVQQFIDQCIGNEGGHSRGRQMPLHYGSKKLHYVTISAPLSTEMPQAAGYAYASRQAGSKNCVVCYFGDGAASEGDAHAAFNFASTLEVPVVYICRNNGYAISTHSYEQYHGDGVASRGVGYGMCSIRVDGNDVLAVYNTVKAAREIALKESRPVLIECMTYRLGGHGTSDDPTKYRGDKETSYWAKHHPISRFNKYLTKKGLWDDEQDKQFQEETKKMVLDCIETAEEKLKADPYVMFTDVYDKMTPRLEKQADYLTKHLKDYREEYPMLDKFHLVK